MPLDRIADITINLQEPPIALASFQIPLIAATLTADQVTAFGADTTMEVAADTWEDAMTDLGVTSSERLYTMLADMFAQAIQPELVVIGRRATAVAQVYTYDLAGFDDGTYTITINGTAFDYVAASAADASVIRDGLIAAINGGTEPVTAAIADADSLTVTGDTAGVSFTSAVSSTGSALTQTVTTASVGLAQDLATFRSERNDWYLVLETSRDSDVIYDTAGTVETLRKLLVVQTDDADAQTAGADTDIGSRLGAAGYTRTAVFWHNNDDDHVDAAAVGKIGQKAPGSATWANHALASVTGITPTSATTLDDKNYNWLESFTAAGFSMTQGGKVASGQWIDLIIGRDWLHNLLQIRLVTLLRAADKIPYTQEGAAMVAGVIGNALLEAASAGLVVRSSISVSMPNVSELDSSTRASRILPNVRASAVLQGAMHQVRVTINLGS